MDKEAQAQSAASTSESYENLMTVSSQYESGEYSDATLADTLLNVNRDALGQSGQALYDELSTEIFREPVRQNIRMEWQHSMLQIMRRRLMHWESSADG